MLSEFLIGPLIHQDFTHDVLDISCISNLNGTNVGRLRPFGPSLLQLLAVISIRRQENFRLRRKAGPKQCVQVGSVWAVWGRSHNRKYGEQSNAEKHGFDRTVGMYKDIQRLLMKAVLGGLLIARSLMADFVISELRLGTLFSI